MRLYSKNLDSFRTGARGDGHTLRMKYSQFEELPVWKAAIEFALKVFEFTSGAEFRGFGDTKNQLERAAVSISNNIEIGRAHV